MVKAAVVFCFLIALAVVPDWIRRFTSSYNSWDVPHHGIAFVSSLVALGLFHEHSTFSHQDGPPWELLLALSWWKCFSHAFSRFWPRVLKNQIPEYVVQGGPLGQGCFKVCQAVLGLWLWYISMRLQTEDSSSPSIPPLPHYLLLRSLPSLAWLLGVLLFSAMVNVVLILWSRVSQSRGNHSGVHQMVQGSLGRSLSAYEHVQLGCLAAINAICEEITARVVWRSAFAYATSHLPYSDHDQQDLVTNLGQSAIFGIWHYHGIPSGWTGVGLTFVYGFLMAWLADQCGSLWLSLLSHAIADYYIFAVLVRQRSNKGIAKES